MHHCQTPWLPGILVPVRGLEIKSHLIAKPRARTPRLGRWRRRGPFLYANAMQLAWQPWIMLQLSKEHLHLFDVNHVVRSYNRISLLSSAATFCSTHAASSPPPPLRPRPYWALVTSCPLTPLGYVVVTACSCKNDFGAGHRHSEYRFPSWKESSCENLVSWSNATHLYENILIFLRLPK